MCERSSALIVITHLAVIMHLGETVLRGTPFAARHSRLMIRVLTLGCRKRAGHFRMKETKMKETKMTTSNDLSHRPFRAIVDFASLDLTPKTSERIDYRDGKRYFAILLDNNNRKPALRLHLNGKSVKFVTTFEASKDGVRRDIGSVVDIYTVASEQIRQAIRQYESGGALAPAPPEE